jgi:hypothetical protein
MSRSIVVLSETSEIRICNRRWAIAHILYADGLEVKRAGIVNAAFEQIG